MNNKMKELEIFISLTGTCLGLLVTAATFLVKFLRNAKAKRIAEQTIKIGNAVMPYIKQAEGFANYSGAEKKEYVMTKANQFALEQGFPFNTALVGEKVEELVQLTKKVNVRDKDKPAVTQAVQPVQSAQAVNAGSYQSFGMVSNRQ